MDEEAARIQSRLAEGSALADRLIGMLAEDATTLVLEAGFVPQSIPASATAYILDMRPDRVRFLVDEEGVVLSAWAG